MYINTFIVIIYFTGAYYINIFNEIEAFLVQINLRYCNPIITYFCYFVCWFWQVLVRE